MLLFRDDREPKCDTVWKDKMIKRHIGEMWLTPKREFLVCFTFRTVEKASKLGNGHIQLGSDHSRATRHG